MRGGDNVRDQIQCGKYVSLSPLVIAPRVVVDQPLPHSRFPGVGCGLTHKSEFSYQLRDFLARIVFRHHKARTQRSCIDSILCLLVVSTVSPRALSQCPALKSILIEVDNQVALILPLASVSRLRNT